MAPRAGSRVPGRLLALVLTAMVVTVMHLGPWQWGGGASGQARLSFLAFSSASEATLAEEAAQEAQVGRWVGWGGYAPSASCLSLLLHMAPEAGAEGSVITPPPLPTPPSHHGTALAPAHLPLQLSPPLPNNTDAGSAVALHTRSCFLLAFLLLSFPFSPFSDSPRRPILPSCTILPFFLP